MTTIARQSQFHATLAPSMPPNPIVVFDTSKGTFKAELFLDKTPVTASNIVDLARNGFYDGLHFHRVIEGFMLVRASRRPASIDVETREDVFVVKRTRGVHRSRAMKTTDEIHSIVTESQQFGCPHSRDPRSEYAGTGGPAPSSTFTNLVTGEVVTRDAREGCVPDEFVDETTNDVGALSMANTGQPHSGGSQFFINTAHNDFLDHWRSDLSPSQHPVFGRVVEGMDVVESIERAPVDAGDAPRTPVTMIRVTIE